MTAKTAPATCYDAVAQSNKSTVLAEYIPTARKETSYQSEAKLEAALIEQLEAQGYERMLITSEEDLKPNLRMQLEKLNGIEFSDAEWEGFFTTVLAKESAGVLEKTELLQSEDTAVLLDRDDGTRKNVRLIDKRNIHNNRLQVISQYNAKGSRANRYDVTILVNGLPMVHVELKRRGVDLREAFNQIERYQQESFWAGAGLFQYVQLFIISNGTLTRYYSNTVRQGHTDKARGRKGSAKSHFVFATHWADQKNRPINELADFTRTFLSKRTLLAVLAKYCVFDVQQQLLVMRPYQIAATERILERLAAAPEHGDRGAAGQGGYVWHTTGSGKTLTSFKVSQMAQALPGVDKVLFVVDRKDLDYQTMREYERFKKGSANATQSSGGLQRLLELPDARIIITTIQKLDRFVSRNAKHPVYAQHVVMVFDECHRSQFGSMHRQITRKFKRHSIFGFTGTPIFAENAPPGAMAVKTTEQAFGDRLHSYTVVDAIRDENVLPFRIDYMDAFGAKAEDGGEQAEGDRNAVDFGAPRRVEEVVKYVLGHFAQKTKRVSSGKGFNSLFAAESIAAAKAYYSEFKRQQEALPDGKRLKIGLIFSFSPNEDVDAEGGWLRDEPMDGKGLDESSRLFLEKAIGDYNRMFRSDFGIEGDGFQNYYKDLSKRIKAGELDLCIVVNMLLTGFDAPTLNTLWVDRPLRHHGLMQAFSRTNRILDSVKAFGNIVAFRDLEERTKDALALFGSEDAEGTVFLEPYEHHLEKYRTLVESIRQTFPLDAPPEGEGAQRKFCRQFGELMRVRNVLQAFDDFEGDVEAEDLMAGREMQDYQSHYLELNRKFAGKRESGGSEQDDDLVFEIELIKSVEYGVVEILALVESAERHGRDALDELRRAIESSPSLRDRKDLFERFYADLPKGRDVAEAWRDFVLEQKEAELAEIVAEEKLNEQAARHFVERAFQEGELPRHGTSITTVLPPMRRFGRDSDHAEKKERVLDALEGLFQRFRGLS